MKITQVHIDQFSGWQDTTLDLPDGEMHVLYGPNETGKSTLLRFVRGVLYGFAERDRLAAGVQARRTSCSGYLRVTHSGCAYVIHRETGPRGGELVRVSDEQGSELSPGSLAELLCGVDAETFENVFALGLPELQEVATLGADEIAEHVYHASLGPTGRRLIDALTEARHRRKLLLDEDGQHGSLAALVQRIGELDEQISLCEQDVARYDEIREDLRRIESELQDQQRRQDGLESQLRGHEFLERVAGPWRKVADIRLEIDQLLHVAHIPEGGLQRLDELDLEIDNLKRQRRKLAAEGRQLARSSRALNADSQIAGCTATIRVLLQKREEFIRLQSRLPELREETELARMEVDETLSRLGEGWHEQRIESVDTTPGCAVRLSRAGRRYAEVLKRRKREVRRYQRVASRLQQRQAELTQQFKPFQASDAAEALERCQREQALLEAISADESRAEALEQTQEELAEELSAREESRSLPPYFFTVLLAFGVLGVVLLVAGVTAFVRGGSGHTPWLVGLILTLLGVACGGVTWSVKRYFDPDDQQNQSLNGRLQLAADQLAQLQRQIAENRRSLGVLESKVLTEDRVTAEKLEAARARLVDAERLVRDEQAIRARRTSLSRFRERIRETQRTVSAVRRDWCRLLNELGLDESVRVDAPLEQWREAAETAQKLAHCRSVAEELRRAEQSTDEFLNEVVHLAGKINEEDAERGDVIALLADWEQRLSAWETTWRRRAELRRESRRRRRAAEQMAEKLSRLRRQRLEHLAAAGAADRDEFEERVRAVSRRHELEEDLRVSNDELTQAARTEPELAIVEEDLRGFDGAANRAAIDAIRDELADLSADVAASHERTGRLRQELQQIESDRRVTTLRFDRAQLRHQLVDDLESLGSIEVVASALDHARSELERDHQPRTLLRASDFLSQLTRGAYHRVWTRIGERRLLVDEADGATLDVERLSAGTREQLFLAIRLALIDHLRGHDVRLPLVLDDVLVNFDEDRTAAAVRTLCDAATLGQQILVFTCHQHLVERFRSEGVSTTHLPGRAVPSVQRRVG